MGFPFWLDDAIRDVCGLPPQSLAWQECSVPMTKAISRLWFSVAIVKVSLFEPRINNPGFILRAALIRSRPPDRLRLSDTCWHRPVHLGECIAEGLTEPSRMT
jgi:hypothetical protein